MSPSVERNNQSHCLWRLVNLLEHELLYTAQKNYRISLIFYKSWQFPATQRLLPNTARAELDFLQMRTKATTSGSEEIPTRNQQLISSTISSDWIAVTVNAALLGSLTGSHVHLIVDFTNRQKKKKHYMCVCENPDVWLNFWLFWWWCNESLCCLELGWMHVRRM